MKWNWKGFMDGPVIDDYLKLIDIWRNFREEILGITAVAPEHITLESGFGQTSREIRQYIPKEYGLYELFFNNYLDPLLSESPTHLDIVDFGANSGTQYSFPFIQRLLSHILTKNQNQIPKITFAAVDFDSLGLSRFSEFKKSAYQIDGMLHNQPIEITEPIRAYAHETKMPDSSKDLIISNAMINWIDSPYIQKTFDEFQRILRPGGMGLIETTSIYNACILGVHNLEWDPTQKIMRAINLNGLLKHIKENPDIPYPFFHRRFKKFMYLYNTESLKKLAENSGFEIINAFYFRNGSYINPFGEINYPKGEPIDISSKYKFPGVASIHIKKPL